MSTDENTATETSDGFTLKAAARIKLEAGPTCSVLRSFLLMQNGRSEHSVQPQETASDISFISFRQASEVCLNPRSSEASRQRDNRVRACTSSHPKENAACWALTAKPSV
jgi:hypothetical protein